jgi:hypothetical protein
MNLLLLPAIIVDHTRDGDGMILRVVTATGTPGGTPSTAVYFALYDRRGPGKLDIAVRAMMHMRVPLPILLYLLRMEMRKVVV